MYQFRIARIFIDNLFCHVLLCGCITGGVMALGNLFRQPLGEILDGKRARAIYDGFSRRTAVEELCRRCGYAKRFQ